MKKLFFISALLLFFVLGLKAQDKIGYQETQARQIIQPQMMNVYAKPLTVEIKVDEAVGMVEDTWQITPAQLGFEGMKTIKFNPIEFNEKVHNIAILLSSQKHNADVIIAPTFNIVTDDVSKGVTVTIRGLLGHFVNWRSIAPSDYEWIRLAKFDTVGDKTTYQAYVKKTDAPSNEK